MPGEIFDDLQEVSAGLAVKTFSLQVECRKSISIKKPTCVGVLAGTVVGSLSAYRLLGVPFPLQGFFRSSTLKIGNEKIVGGRIAVARTCFTLKGYIIAFCQVLIFLPL